MKKPKSQALRVLLRCFNQASYLEKNKISDPLPFQEIQRLHDPSRRAFLKNSASAIVGISLASLPLSSCATKGLSGSKFNKKNQPRIAIVGGGIAGLHCAYVLKKSGVHSTIYEGDNRTGGRIFTRNDVFAPGMNTEFGAEFIDTNHLDMINLAEELGIEKYDTFPDYASGHITKDTFFFNDRHYSEAEVITEFRNITGKLESDKMSCGEAFDTPQCESLDNTSIEEYVRGLNCNIWMQDLIIYAYTAEYGLDAGDQSALNFIDMISTDTSEGFKIFGESDERYKLTGGNDLITKRLAEKVTDQINMGHKLTAIQSKGSGYNLVFANGKEVEADFVVMAIPFTILREIELKIEGISPEKLNCINQLGYGQNNKLILGYNGRPWRETQNPFAGYLFNPIIQNGWDSGHMQNNNKGATGYTILLGGALSLEVAKSGRDIGVRDMVADTLAQKYMLKLEEVFPGTKAQFTGMNKAALWTNNPFVKASYGCYRPGQWTTISGLEAEPVGNIFFAGEHCSENFQGYMNGGAETGRRVAEGLILKLK